MTGGRNPVMEICALPIPLAYRKLEFSKTALQRLAFLELLSGHGIVMTVIVVHLHIIRELSAHILTRNQV